MHPNFYHWHERAEIKPDTSILEPRWNAAAKFASATSSADTCSLLRLALFANADGEFTRRFSEELVKAEPTFPPEKNGELLRVMASAALFSQMETETVNADAVALGLKASAFLPARLQPVCSELLKRSFDYLSGESERLRPTPDLNGKFSEFEKAADTDGWEENTETVKILGDAVLELGETMSRIAEENQFLWWLLSRHSSVLNVRRATVTCKGYALIVADEAAKRVALIPPPASVEALIAEVLSQCLKPSNSPLSLVDFVNAASPEWLKTVKSGGNARELLPITSLLNVCRTGGAVDNAALREASVPENFKISPSEAANQYFHELMFLRALERLK